MISNYVWKEKLKKGKSIFSLRADLKLQIRRRSCWVTQKNAFNGLYRDLARRNTEKVCTSLYHSKCNSYRELSNLFIKKQTIFFQEDTNPGNPLAMRCMELPLPLIELLETFLTVQKWYVDNGNAVGSLYNLKKAF